MERKYQVFISSTYEDLKTERQAAISCLLDMNCIPVGMEQFPASSLSQWEYIKKMIDMSDYYLLIVAGKYGSIDPEENISYTVKEYRYAIHKKMPILAFLHKNIDSLPAIKVGATDEERERIIEAIENINTTGILEGIDEDIANRIRAEIVEDYLNGEIELDGITIEELQEYIENHPEIQVGFEINEAIQNFESLIEAGILTTEDIKVVIENNVEIHDSEESFIEAYVEAGGLQEDISEIESFYDPETQTVHIRDTADSVIITNSIITILGEEIFIDEETGEVSYYDPDHVEIGESDTTIEMPDGTVDESGNMTDVEIDEDNTTIEVPDGTVDESGNITDAEINEDNTTIEMPEGTVDESGNITDAEINEDNTTVDISDDGVVSEEETQVKMDNQTAKTDE